MKIPMSVIAGLEKGRKNVLIISMSTFQKGSKPNYYYVKHTGEEISSFYCGRYSMEPGTKHILTKLNNEGRKLDKVIMLSTPEARNAFGSDKLENAVAYYVDEIKRFIQDGDILENCGEINGLSDQDRTILRDFTTRLNNVSYSREELDRLFVEIPLSDMSKLSYEAIPRIVEEVLQINTSGINLFLDMQGGSRVSTFIVNAAVNMLQDDSIVLERSYATLYNRTNMVHQLRDESLSNHVFDMVSGMDEFLNYGHAKKFDEYFLYYKEHYKNGEVPAEEPIVKTIRKISDTISICDIDGFYAGLDSLKMQIEKYKKMDSEKKDPIFRAFIEKLLVTYEGILTPNRRALDVMEWCLKKGWYQQALTVCESKMPQQMIDERVVYYCKNGSERKAALEKLAQYYHSPEGRSYVKGVKDSAIFVVKNYKYMYKGKNRTGGSLLELIADGELYSDYCGRDTMSKLAAVLNGYFKLAGMRNKVNHVGQAVNLNELKREMTSFIGCYRALVRNEVMNGQLQECTVQMKEIEKYKTK